MCGEFRRVRYTTASSSGTTMMGRLRSLAHVRRLRTLLTLGDFELHLVAFLQALVSFGGDCAVVNKYVWPIRATDEPVPLGVIEPLNGSFQAFHVPPTFRTPLKGVPGRAPAVVHRMHFGTAKVGCQGNAAGGEVSFSRDS